MTTDKVRRLRERFPKGTRVRLMQFDPPDDAVPPGTEGEVSTVDDAGTVHVSWDNGRNLGLVATDRWRVVR
jgi:hypothetical protein